MPEPRAISPPIFGQKIASGGAESHWLAFQWIFEGSEAVF